MLVVDEDRTLVDALQRAARELGLHTPPADTPIDMLRAAVDEYRALFRPQQLQSLERRRRLALDAMQTFTDFRPRLSGSLVHGDGPLDRVRLMLDADTPEQVIMALSDQGIPWQEGEATLVFAGGRRDARPALRFMAGDTSIELVVLAPADRSNPPRDPLDGTPLAALDADQLRSAIDAN